MVKYGGSIDRMTLHEIDNAEEIRKLRWDVAALKSVVISLVETSDALVGDLELTIKDPDHFEIEITVTIGDVKDLKIAITDAKEWIK